MNLELDVHTWEKLVKLAKEKSTTPKKMVAFFLDQRVAPTRSNARNGKPRKKV